MRITSVLVSIGCLTLFLLTPQPAHAQDDDFVVSGLNQRLLELEDRVFDLQERVAAAKKRVTVLKVHMLNGTINAETRLVIVHVNDMGPFRLVAASYQLDQVDIFNEKEHAILDEDQFELFNAEMEPGPHTLTLTLDYTGETYGLFPYMEGYDLTIDSHHEFTVEKGMTLQIRVVAYESGDFTDKHEERPDVRFEIEVFTPDQESLELSTM